MARLASTGKFHVGFAERGLKDWAKKNLARTAQKHGGGIFEGLHGTYPRKVND